MRPRSTLSTQHRQPLAPFRTLAGIVVALAVVASPLEWLDAATNLGNVTVSITISAAAKLTLSSSTVTFPSADPDTMPSIAATEGAITVTAKAKTSTGSPVSVTVLAAGDLTSGSDTIPAGNVSWTVTGAGFVAGTMNKTTEQTLASWSGSGSRLGTQSYRLTNSWSYPTGTFATTATYTLTAP